MKVKTSIVKKNTKKNTKRVNKRKTLRRNYRTISKIGGGDFYINSSDLDKYGIAYYKKYDREEINKLKLPTQYIVSAEIIEQNSKLELKSGIVEPETENKYKNTYESILYEEINNKTYVIDNLEEINDEHFVKDDKFEQCLYNDYHRSKLYFLNDESEDIIPYFITENTENVTKKNIEVSIKDFLINKFKSSNVNHTLISEILCQGLSAYVFKKKVFDKNILNAGCTMGASHQFIFDKRNNKFVKQYNVNCSEILKANSKMYVASRVYVFCDLFIDEPTTDNKIYMTTIWDKPSYKKFLNEIWLKPEYTEDDKQMIIQKYVNSLNNDEDLKANIDIINKIIEFIDKALYLISKTYFIYKKLNFNDDTKKNVIYYLSLINILHFIQNKISNLVTYNLYFINMNNKINVFFEKYGNSLKVYIEHNFNEKNKKVISYICTDVITEINNIKPLINIVDYILQLDKEAIIYKDKSNLTRYNSLVSCIFSKISNLNEKHQSIEKLNIILAKIKKIFEK